jgi:hypothetical protein
MPLGHPSAIDLAAWFDGEGDRDTGAHVDDCERCQRQLDDLARLRSHIRSAPLPDPLEAAPGALPPSSGRAGRDGGAALRRLAPLLVVVAFVVVIVLLVVLGGR